jgi:hypothetical protein
MQCEHGLTLFSVAAPRAVPLPGWFAREKGCLCKGFVMATPIKAGRSATP